MSNLQQRIAALVPTMDGWCTVEKAQELALAVLKLRSSVTVEIGVYGGRSLAPMAMAHKEQGHGIVWAIDPWSPAASVEAQNAANADWWGKLDHEMIRERFLAHIKVQSLQDFVRVIRMKSDDVVVPPVIDMLHVDGNHSEQAIRDVERFAVNVRKGGFCFMDDINWDGGAIVKAVDVLQAMGFVKLFDRDTGAMFQRTEIPGVKKQRGWPKGKPRRKKVVR